MGTQRSAVLSGNACAIILAAGVGRRLASQAPKVTLAFAGKSLLARHIAALDANGVTDIAITVGYRADLIREELARIGALERVVLIDNPRYREGSIVSLWAQQARLAAGRTVLLMDGDVLCDSRMIARLLAAAPENALLLDQAIEPGDEPVKICLRGGVIVDFAKIPRHRYDRHGESVGFFRFSPNMAAALAGRVAAYVEEEGGAAEYEAAIRDLILAHPDRFGCEDISDLPWTEIDFDVDVARARQNILPRLQEVAQNESSEDDRGGAEQPQVSAPPLSAQQLAMFRSSGWLAVRGFCTSAEIAELARWIDDLVAMPEEPGRVMVYHEPSLVDSAGRIIQRIEYFCPFHAGFRAFASGRLREAINQLLGAPSSLFKEKINFKMPGGAGFEPHQDQQAGWSRYAPLFVTALVTIDRATLENGCLEMPEGPRVARLIGEEWRPLMPDEMQSFALVPIPTEPGDVMFFDSYAPHASKPNRSDRPRRVLYLTYNAASAGDHRRRYFAEKRAAFPPDIERAPDAQYKFRV